MKKNKDIALKDVNKFLAKNSSVFLEFLPHRFDIKTYWESQFITEYRGRIFFRSKHDETTEAGLFDVTYVDTVSAMNLGYDIRDVFDEQQDTFDAYEAIMATGYERFAEAIYELTGGFDGGVLIIDRLFIKEKFRGHNKSLTVLNGLITKICRTVGLVLLKPYPLQLNETGTDKVLKARFKKLGYNNFVKDPIEATKKLEKLYKKIGFSKIEDTKFMLRPAWTSKKYMSI